VPADDFASWLPVPAAHRRLSVERQDQDPHSALSGWRRFLEWRRDMPVLRHGRIAAIRRSGTILSFERVLDESRLLCLFNLAAEPAVFCRDGAEIALAGWGTAFIQGDGTAP
jgi:alpha-glucosidase